MENRTSFGLDAGAYKAFRPTYPDALYAWLASQCRQRNAALDCATGSGQAALSLVEYFDRVVATDTDEAQIASAPPHERIEYVVVAAEELPSDMGPFDLVTIAQGAHWFDLDRFYRCLKPLLVPDGIIAIWGYSHPRISPRIDPLLERCLVAAVDPYWAQGNRVIMDHYRSIEFPWQEIEAPPFIMREHWNRDAFFGYVRTWSSYKRLIAAGEPDPLLELARQLDAEALWPNDAAQQIEFDIHLRVGRNL
jgi:SAM-dependent methyltransferase